FLISFYLLPSARLFTAIGPLRLMMIVQLLVCKIIYRLCFNRIHSLFVAVAILFQDMLDLSDSDNREKLGEKEIAGEEQPECTQVKTNLPDSRRIICTPGTGQVVAVYRGHDDHKPFEPHTDIHQYTHEEG